MTARRPARRPCLAGSVVAARARRRCRLHRTPRRSTRDHPHDASQQHHPGHRRRTQGSSPICNSGLKRAARRARISTRTHSQSTGTSWCSKKHLRRALGVGPPHDAPGRCVLASARCVHAARGRQYRRVRKTRDRARLCRVSARERRAVDVPDVARASRHDTVFDTLVLAHLDTPHRDARAVTFAPSRIVHVASHGSAIALLLMSPPADVDTWFVAVVDETGSERWRAEVPRQPRPYDLTASAVALSDTRLVLGTPSNDLLAWDAATGASVAVTPPV